MHSGGDTSHALQLHPSRQALLHSAGTAETPWNPDKIHAVEKITGGNEEPLERRRDSAYESVQIKVETEPRRECLELSVDFGSGQPLPPSRSQPLPPRPQGPPNSRRFDSSFRSLSAGHDPELLRYLAGRRVSPGFLVEIDLFLSNHPELVRHAPSFCRVFNGSSPLDAYLFFVRGYTRPARYLDGVLPESERDIRIPYPVPSMCSARDSELIDFFSGHCYRYDILEKIDDEVAGLCGLVQAGSRLTRAQRLLVGYALHGNPADAYKCYEYNFQTEWLPHRHLPEHVALAEVPRGENYSEPVPRLLAPPDSPTPENRRGFPQTRTRMARATDAGVDVIDVLLQDFVAELARQGYRRTEIHEMKTKAQDAIRHERDTAGGRDIVDLVMSMAIDRRVRSPDGIDRDTRLAPPGKRGKAEWHKERLRTAKHTLEKLYKQECHMRRTIHSLTTRFNVADSGSIKFNLEGDGFPNASLNQIVQTRRRMERCYVHELVGYGFSAGTMSNTEAVELQLRYSKDVQESRERKGGRLNLLRLCPKGI